MKYAILFTMVITAVSAFAAIPKGCNEIKSQQIRLAILGASLSNAALSRDDRRFEFRSFNDAVAKLRELGHEQLCDSVITDNGNSIFLSYSTGTGVKEDIFNLNENGQVVSWLRVDSHNASSVLNFKRDGKVALRQ